MKKVFKKNDIKAITKNMSEAEAELADMIAEALNEGYLDMDYYLHVGTDKREVAILIVIYAAIQATETWNSRYSEVVAKVASRLRMAQSEVRATLMSVKLHPDKPKKYFGKDVMVYDRMGLDNFTVE